MYFINGINRKMVCKKTFLITFRFLLNAHGIRVLSSMCIVPNSAKHIADSRNIAANAMFMLSCGAAEITRMVVSL